MGKYSSCVAIEMQIEANWKSMLYLRCASPLALLKGNAQYCQGLGETRTLLVGCNLLQPVCKAKWQYHL